MADEYPYSRYLVESDPSSGFLFDGQLLPTVENDEGEMQNCDTSIIMDSFSAVDLEYQAPQQASNQHHGARFDDDGHAGSRTLQHHLDSTLGAPLHQPPPPYDMSDMSRNNSLASSQLGGHDEFYSSPNTSHHNSYHPTPALSRNGSDVGHNQFNGDASSGRKRRRNGAVSYSEPLSDADLSDEEHDAAEERPPRRRMKSSNSVTIGITDNPVAEQVRERNRLAATKCRNKKKAEAEILRMNFEGMAYERDHWAAKAKFCEHESSKVWCLLPTAARDDYLRMSGGIPPPGVTLSAAYAHLHGGPIPGASGPPPPPAPAHPPYPPPGMATTFVAADGVSYMLQRRDSEVATSTSYPPPNAQTSPFVLPILGPPPKMGPMPIYAMPNGHPQAPLNIEVGPSQQAEDVRPEETENVTALADSA